MSEDDEIVHRATGCNRRGRGQPALAKLASTAQFTNEDRLSSEDRKLILFLVVVLADAGDGVLTAAYRAVLDRHADVDGHWSHGKSLAAMQKSCGKFLGRSAERRPSWDKIEDLVMATLDGEYQRAVLAHAAGLFCRAAHRDLPEEGYRGEIVTPQWAVEETVTIATIRAQLIGLRPRTRPVADPVQEELVRLRTENEMYREVQDTLIRAFRKVMSELDEYRRHEHEMLRLHLTAVNSDAPVSPDHAQLWPNLWLIDSRGVAEKADHP